MKRFLALLAGGLLVAATATTSSAQVSFNQIKLGTGSNILTIAGPSSGGSDTYAFPAPSGASKQILTTSAGQNIDGTLTASVDGAILSGLRLAPTYNDNAHTGVTHASLILGMPTAAGSLYISDATGNYGIVSPGTLTGNHTYTLPDATGTVALTSDITSALSSAISGTADKMAKFTGSGNTIGDSKLSDDGSNLVYNGTFNVSSTGAVTGATGLTSSGTIKFSGVSTGVVHADGTGQLSGGNVDLGTEVTGTLTGTHGGTGVNNGSKTITLGGNFATSGANDVTLTTTGSTNVTLPTSGTLATTGGSVQYGGSNAALSAATTKLFDVSYTDVTTSGNLAGAAITADGSNSTGASNVSSTGLTLNAVGKGTGNVTALSVSATGGTGTRKAIDASGAIVSNATIQGANLVANNASNGLTIGNGASATVLSSTATSAQAISFPDNSGTVALTSDISSAVSGAISGTVGAIPKFATANSIGDSKASDNGSVFSYTGGALQVSTASATNGPVLNLVGGTQTWHVLAGKSGDAAGVNNLAIANNSDGWDALTIAAGSGNVAIHGGTFTLGSGANATAVSSTATTARSINTPDANGTLAINTSSGDVKFAGLSSSHTYTLPDADATLATTAGTVLFNVAATQTTTTAANNIFDVTSAPTTGTALGAKITSTGNGAVADNATGLTIAATSGASGTATGISISTSGGTTQNAINATSGNIVASTGNLVTGNGSTAGHTKISNGAFFADVVSQSGSLTADRTYTIPTTPDANATFALTTGGGSVIFTGPTTSHTYTLPDADATIATSGGTVAYGGSNSSLTAGATKLFNVSYGAIGASASTAGAAITSDASGGSNTDVPATGLTVSSVSKGNGNSTALSLSATGGTGTLKALDVTAGSSSFAGDVSFGGNVKGYGPNKFANIETLSGTGAAQNFTINNTNVTASSLIIVTTKVSSTGNHYLPVLESVNAGNFIVNLSGIPASGETVSLSYIVIN